MSESIEAVGLTAQARTPVANLSGGQQRRVLIARSLATQPDLLVLDEPTTGVDAASQRSMARILAELRELGLTVVMITHELGPVSSLTSRVVVMRDGVAVFDGDPENAPSGSGGDEHHAHGAPTRGRPGVGLLGDR